MGSRRPQPSAPVTLVEPLVPCSSRHEDRPVTITGPQRHPWLLGRGLSSRPRVAMAMPGTYDPKRKDGPGIGPVWLPGTCGRWAGSRPREGWPGWTCAGPVLRLRSLSAGPVLTLPGSVAWQSPCLSPQVPMVVNELYQFTPTPEPGSVPGQRGHGRQGWG